jgi:dihydrolipoamide dehydrogenase
MKTVKHDLVVLGGGPAGYVAAIRAAQLGLAAACVDDNPLLGGTCLRIGCIPSKALLESTAKFAEVQHDLKQHGIHVAEATIDLAAMLRRKDDIVRSLARGVEGLFKKHKITRYQGRGKLDGPGRVRVAGGDGETLLEARSIVIATGSQPASLPGVQVDGDRIGTSSEALAYARVPEHLVVIGAGYIGLELGSVWNRLGAKVTVLEAMERILPGLDTEIAAQAQPIFEKQGLVFKLGVRVTRAYVDGEQAVVECEAVAPIRCDRVLLAVGRVPCTTGLGLESAGIHCDPRGRISVNPAWETAAKNIYAVGDCIAGPMLAHKASDEAAACVERIVTGYGHVNYDAIPAVVYTHPEIAAVGKTEDELRSGGREYKKGVFPFRANGRARTLGDTQGMVKVLADAHTDRLLGVHILGPRAGDLIAEAVVSLDFAASSEDIARSSHAHPTLAEALHEAALDVAGRAVNAP